MGLATFGFGAKGTGLSVFGFGRLILFFPAIMERTLFVIREVRQFFVEE
jgi:hypothetical protein